MIYKYLFDTHALKFKKKISSFSRERFAFCASIDLKEDVGECYGIRNYYFTDENKTVGV